MLAMCEGVRWSCINEIHALHPSCIYYILYCQPFLRLRDGVVHLVWSSFNYNFCSRLLACLDLYRLLEFHGLLGNHFFVQCLQIIVKRSIWISSSTLCFANVQSLCSSNANLWMFSLKPIPLTIIWYSWNAISLVCVSSMTFIFNCTRFIDCLHSLILKIHALIVTSSFINILDGFIFLDFF